MTACLTRGTANPGCRRLSGGAPAEKPAAGKIARPTRRFSGVLAVLLLTTASSASAKVSFLKDVMPILNKAGCTQGTCHGAAKGKNGFKLSLRGYDPEYDYRAL